MTTTIFACLLALLTACQSASPESLRSEIAQAPTAHRNAAGDSQPAKRNSGKLIHVLVALCDNEFQGIVPVPARIGNGDDPANNLYWGARFGVKTFFKRAGDWRLIEESKNPRAGILERLVFKHQAKNAYLVADAYRGREIKRCVADFFEFSAGRAGETINANSIELYAGGGADLIAYVGHDGLMDFSLDSFPQKADDRQRDAVMLACVSKRYFAEPLRKTGARPLLWTTGLMAPEAYVLKAAIDGWVLNEDGEGARRRAATAYNQYQRCGMNAAMKLFSTGW
ncbi:MAG TPA: hypothetical protein VJ810_00415 [Blastocatellia bacterium]|nr:hypothetical protein [Blastocatellia bacterium]